MWGKAPTAAPFARVGLRASFARLAPRPQAGDEESQLISLVNTICDNPTLVGEGQGGGAVKLNNRASRAQRSFRR